jgi:cell division septum initiation protein DivIVA
MNHDKLTHLKKKSREEFLKAVEENWPELLSEVRELKAQNAKLLRQSGVKCKITILSK